MLLTEVSQLNPSVPHYAQMAIKSNPHGTFASESFTDSTHVLIDSWDAGKSLRCSDAFNVYLTCCFCYNTITESLELHMWKILPRKSSTWKEIYTNINISNIEECFAFLRSIAFDSMKRFSCVPTEETFKMFRQTTCINKMLQRH